MNRDRRRPVILQDFRGLGPALRQLAERERQRARVRQFLQEAEAESGGPERGDPVGLSLWARSA